MPNRPQQSLKADTKFNDRSPIHTPRPRPNPRSENQRKRHRQRSRTTYIRTSGHAQTMRSPTSTIKQGRPSKRHLDGQRPGTDHMGREGREGHVLTDQDAIPVAGGGNPNPRRESAQAGREAAARSGEGGARRRKQSGKCERSRGRGGQKKNTSLFSRPCPLSLVLLLFWDLSCGWTVLPSLYKAVRERRGPAPVTGGTRRRICPELRWKPPGFPFPGGNWRPGRTETGSPQ